MTDTTRKPRQRVTHTLDTLLTQTQEVGDCLEWTGSCMNRGHPVVHHDGKPWMVRRLVLTLTGHQLKPRHVVGVACGNPRCINPDHLVQLSHRQRMKAMRMASAATHTYARSAKVAATKRAGPQAKLTDAQVQAIRHGHQPQRETAALYGVSPHLVASIRSGRRRRDFSNPFAGLMT